MVVLLVCGCVASRRPSPGRPVVRGETSVAGKGITLRMSGAVPDVWRGTQPREATRLGAIRLRTSERPRPWPPGGDFQLVQEWRVGELDKRNRPESPFLPGALELLAAPQRPEACQEGLASHAGEHIAVRSRPLGSLSETLQRIPDSRSRKARRFPLGAVSSLVVLGLLRGHVHLHPVVRQATRLNQQHRPAVPRDRRVHAVG